MTLLCKNSVHTVSFICINAKFCYWGRAWQCPIVCITSVTKSTGMRAARLLAPSLHIVYLSFNLSILFSRSIKYIQLSIYQSFYTQVNKKSNIHQSTNQSIIYLSINLKIKQKTCPFFRRKLRGFSKSFAYVGSVAKGNIG